jgi:integrase
MNESIFETLPERTKHVWWQTHELLGDDFHETFISLLEWLKKDGKALPRYLLEAKQRPSNCNMQSLTLQLVNAQTKDLQEAYKKVTALRHIVITGNERAVWLLEVPSIPILAVREKGRFTPKRFSSLPKYGIWKSALDHSILGQAKLSEEAEIGQVLLSAVIYGGLLSSHLLAGLLKNINKAPGILNNRAYIDLSLSWLGHQDAENRRWFPDALSEILIWKLSAKNISDPATPELKQNALTKVVFKYVSSFFKESTLDNAYLPRNITEFLDSCALKFDLMLPPFISNYCQRKHLSHSVRQPAWERIESLGQKASSGEIANTLTLEHWTSSLVLSEADQLYEKDNSDGILQIPRIATGLSNVAMQEKLKEIILDYEDSESTIPLLFTWGVRLLSKGKRGRPAPKADTVRGYLKSVGNRLNETLGDERLIDQDAGFIEDIYLEILEDIDSKGLRKKVAQLLYQFHTFLVDECNVVAIDYRSVLGASSAPTPVDANLLLVDEFHQLLKVIEESDLILNHPKMVTATKLLAILGYRCGLRRSEALKLRLVDIHGEHDPMLMIRPFKFRRLKTTASKRILPLTALLESEELHLLQDWIKNRKKEEEESPYSQYLFSIPEKNYGCISEDLVFPAIHSAMRATTGDDSLRYHHFRHSFASLTLLRLMSADHGIPHGVFDNQPDMLKWLERSGEFKDVLYCRKGPTRGHLYYVAFLLGHSSPDVTLEHYVHTLDIITAQIIQKRFQPKQSVLVSASDLPQSTAYRLVKEAPDKLLNKIRKIYGDSPEKRKPLAQQHQSIESKVALGYKKHSDIWKLLFLHSSRDVSRYDLCVRFKLTDKEFGHLLSNVQYLESFTSNDRNKSQKFKMMEQKNIYGDSQLLLCPSRPRLHLDIAMALELSNSLHDFMESSYEFYQTLMDLYVKNAWSTKYLVVFKDTFTANKFIALISLMKLPREWLKLNVLVGQSMTEKEVKCSVREWKKQLAFKPAREIEGVRITDGKSMGDHGWIGLNLVCPEVGKAGLAQRYAFVMALISMCSDQLNMITS